MSRSVIENTSIEVSRLGFGTASLHHLFSSYKRQGLLHAAALVGITHFDTAPYYGYGLAESDLGKFIRKRRAAFTVTTKIGLYPWGPASGHILSVWGRKALGKLMPKVSLPLVNWQVGRARESLRESLKRLGTDYVDFLFLHEPDEMLVNTDEMLHWLESERAGGTLRAWGVAGVSEKVMPLVLASNPLALVVQTQDSLDQRQADFMRSVGRGLQFTYGYLSRSHLVGQNERAETIIREALRRNATGTVLVSTRNVKHLASIARSI